MACSTSGTLMGRPASTARPASEVSSTGRVNSLKSTGMESFCDSMKCSRAGSARQPARRGGRMPPAASPPAPAATAPDRRRPGCRAGRRRPRPPPPARTRYPRRRRSCAGSCPGSDRAACGYHVPRTGRARWPATRRARSASARRGPALQTRVASVPCPYLPARRQPSLPGGRPAPLFCALRS